MFPTAARGPRRARPPGPLPVPLLVQSGYSLLRGTASVDRLVRRAVDLGLDTLALTDRNNLYGAVPFLRTAAAAGLRPLLGAQVTEPSPAQDGGEGPRGIERGPAIAERAALLLIRGPEGYRSLCRLLTRRHLDPGFSLVEAVAAQRSELVVLLEDPGLLCSFRAVLPAESLRALVARPGRGSAREASAHEGNLMATARRLGVGVVASPRVCLAGEEEAGLGRLLAAIRENDLISRLPPGSAPPPGSHLPAPDEIFALFHDLPEALAAGRALAESCRLALADLTRQGVLFPKLPLPPGESAYNRLYGMVQDGVRRRYARITPEVNRRVARELEIIDEMGFTDYFVVVGDLVAAARARGIPTVGRGSGASSTVTYALGISNVDPIRYGLTFERFLHRLRGDLPDLDIDFCWKRRDEAIEHVYATYGRDRVAMISTHNMFQDRGALRETAKALGLSPAVPRAGESWTPECEELARRLVGLPHTLGIHCGGIVIGPGPLDQWVPLEEATKGIVVTQYEMHAVEAVGLVKIDLLGNRALSTLGDAVVLAEREGIHLELDQIPDAEEETGRLVAAGQTLGCFQIESPGMRNLLGMLGTHDLEGTIAALSLIRPGPAGSGMKERFIRRSRGLEPTTFLHPLLEPVLASTFGVMLYEEDVIHVASRIAGIPLELGDLLRRAIAAASSVQADPALGERAPETAGIRQDAPRDPWKGNDLAALENRFLECAVRNGIAIQVARGVWEELARFGCYAFCKAHAAGYGVLAWRSAFLKTHHPGPFFTALFNNHQGMYPLRVHVEEARRRGVALHPPSVLHSETAWTWDGSAVRCGLGQLRGLSEAVRERVLAERRSAPFIDLADLWERSEASAPEVEAMILSGACAGLEPGPTPALLARFHTLRRRGGPPRRDRSAASRGPGLPGVGRSQPPRGLAPWREFSVAQRIAQELSALDVAISGSPFLLVEPALGAFRLGGKRIRAAELPRWVGRQAAVAGMMAAWRRIRTRRDDPMLFLTLEDETGLAECTLFPEVLRRTAGLNQPNPAFLAWGRVEEQHGACTLEVERLEPLSL